MWGLYNKIDCFELPDVNKGKMMTKAEILKKSLPMTEVLPEALCNSNQRELQDASVVVPKAELQDKGDSE